MRYGEWVRPDVPGTGRALGGAGQRADL